MEAPRFVRKLLLALFLSLLTGAFSAQAQPAKQEFQPQVGQEGKDVIWVPTPQSSVNKMLHMAKVTPKAYAMALGTGVEYNPDMVELSKRNAAKEGVGDKAQFMKADLFETDLSQATVITMFLLPDINIRLRPKILDLKPGTRIVSNSFTMGDWKEDESATVTENCSSYCTAYLWIVPAKAEGTWKMPQGDLTLKQTYQMVSGSLKNGSNTTQITNGKLHGDEISFTAGGTQYTGHVNGNKIDGGRWKATGAGKEAGARQGSKVQGFKGFDPFNPATVPGSYFLPRVAGGLRRGLNFEPSAAVELL